MIDRKKLSDAILDQIKKMITSGELKEGDKLPDQNTFAAKLGVSRTSLREALTTLTKIGAIEQRPGYGTVLKSRIPILYNEYLMPPLISDKQATLELLQARKLIELGTVEACAQRAQEEHIGELKQLIDKMEKLLRDEKIDEYIDADVTYHFSIAKIAGNRFLLHLFLTIRGFVAQYMTESFRLMPWMLKRSLYYHRAIFEGIRKRSPSEAKLWMKRHLSDIERAITKYYEAEQNSSKNNTSGASERRKNEKQTYQIRSTREKEKK